MGLGGVLRTFARNSILRRYAIINSFDGALTVLGIIFAEFISGIREPEIVFLPGLGAAIAMLVSGVWGAYFAERAEIKKDINALESHLLIDLGESEFAKNKRRLALVSGLTFGFSPFITALVIITPFFLSSVGVIPIDASYYLSFGLVGAVLFSLGVFSGSIARESMLKQGFVMLFAGVIIGVIFFLLALSGVI